MPVDALSALLRHDRPVVFAVSCRGDRSFVGYLLLGVGIQMRCRGCGAKGWAVVSVKWRG